jgi:hypothetical protein
MHGALDAFERVAHGVMVREVGREERVMRPARRLDIEDRDVRDIQPGKNLEEGRTDAVYRAGDDHMPVSILEWIRLPAALGLDRHRPHRKEMS